MLVGMVALLEKRRERFPSQCIVGLGSIRNRGKEGIDVFVRMTRREELKCDGVEDAKTNQDSKEAQKPAILVLLDAIIGL